MGAKRKRYTQTFKREAVSLVLEKGMTRHAVERQLGLANGLVHRWVKEFQADPSSCFPGNGNLKPHELEIARLRRKNTLLERELEIVKKAVAIFSKGKNQYIDL